MTYQTGQNNKQTFTKNKLGHLIQQHLDQTLSDSWIVFKCFLTNWCLFLEELASVYA